MKFFLTGVLQTAEIGVLTLNRIIDLKTSIEKKKIMTMGRRINQGNTLLQALFTQPTVTIKDVQEVTGLSPKAANDLVQVFLNTGILTETTGYQRNRIFRFEEYLELFRK